MNPCIISDLFLIMQEISNNAQRNVLSTMLRSTDNSQPPNSRRHNKNGSDTTDAKSVTTGKRNYVPWETLLFRAHDAVCRIANEPKRMVISVWYRDAEEDVLHWRPGAVADDWKCFCVFNIGHWWHWWHWWHLWHLRNRIECCLCRSWCRKVSI